MNDIIVIRHAESVWNAVGRWQGQADPPLSEAGIQQTRLAAAGLDDGLTMTTAPAEADDTLMTPGRVMSSDLLRASQTADIIAETLGIGPVTIDVGWRERSVGPWQGLTTAEINQNYPGALATGTRPPDWEYDEVLLERVFPAIHRAADASAAGSSTIIVSHAGIVYAIERYFGKEFERIGNLGGIRLGVQSGRVELGGRTTLAAEVTNPQQKQKRKEVSATK